MGLQLGPSGETILTSDDELRATEREAKRVGLLDRRSRQPRMIGLNARERLRVAGLVALLEVFGLILELVEVRTLWQWQGVAITNTPSVDACCPHVRPKEGSLRSTYCLTSGLCPSRGPGAARTRMVQDTGECAERKWKTCFSVNEGRCR